MYGAYPRRAQHSSRDGPRSIVVRTVRSTPFPECQRQRSSQASDDAVVLPIGDYRDCGCLGGLPHSVAEVVCALNGIAHESSDANKCKLKELSNALLECSREADRLSKN